MHTLNILKILKNKTRNREIGGKSGRIGDENRGQSYTEKFRALSPILYAQLSLSFQP